MSEDKSGLARQLVIPGFILLVVLTTAVILGVFFPELADISPTEKLWRSLADMLIWLGAGWVLVRLLNIVFWPRIMAPRLGGHVPKLLTEVVSVVVFSVVVLGMLNQVFKLPLTGLLTTTGVVGLVVGFALQSAISDFFHGIVLNIDRPFRTGQYIRLFQRGVPVMIGRVDGINWRSTRVATREGTLLVFPNHLISNMMIENLAEPRIESRFSLDFCLDFSVPTERALRVLTAGVRAVKGILQEPAAKARAREVGPMGAEYRVYYWLDPIEFGPNKARHAVICSVLSHLKQSGLSLAYPQRDVHVDRIGKRHLDLEADKPTLLSEVGLFHGLSNDELDTLAAHTELLHLTQGTDVVRYDEPGDSMFVLVEGLLEVSVPSSEDEDRALVVGSVVSGQYFGEMSLLTGERRSATVTALTNVSIYEIPKQAMAALLERRPALAEQISKVVAKRQQLTEGAQDAIGGTQAHLDEHEANLAGRLLGKIARFFGF